MQVQPNSGTDKATTLQTNDHNGHLVEIRNHTPGEIEQLTQLLHAEGIKTLTLDATQFGYQTLLNRLRELKNSDTSPAVVLLKQCSPDHLKKLRRIRRKLGNKLTGVTVFTFQGSDQ